MRQSLEFIKRCWQSFNELQQRLKENELLIESKDEYSEEVSTVDFDFVVQPPPIEPTEFAVPIKKRFYANVEIHKAEEPKVAAFVDIEDIGSAPQASHIPKDECKDCCLESTNICLQKINTNLDENQNQAAETQNQVAEIKIDTEQHTVTSPLPVKTEKNEFSVHCDEPDCKNSFKTEENRRIHKILYHSNLINEFNQCIYCDKKFAKKKLLK